MNLPLPSIPSIYRWTGKQRGGRKAPLSILLPFFQAVGFVFDRQNVLKGDTDGQRPANDLEDDPTLCSPSWSSREDVDPSRPAVPTASQPAD